MAGRKSGKCITPRPASGPSIKIDSTKSKEGDRKRDNFSEKLRVTYTLENRFCSLELTEMGLLDRVFGVKIDIIEVVHDKGSATIGLQALMNQSYGISCGMINEFKGSFEVKKARFCFPPVPDTEALAYGCPDTKVPSCFFLAKKNDMGYVERITAVHCFSVSEDEVYVVAMKITSNKGTGLSAEAKGPIKHTSDYVENLSARIGAKVENAAKEQFLNALFDGPADDDRLQSYSHRNSGMQSLKGLVNASGLMRGFGNGSVFSNCKF